MLSVEDDSNLISDLYKKLFEIQIKSFKAQSHKYSLSDFYETREMTTLYIGIDRVIKHAYKNKQYERAKELKSKIEDHYCDRCIEFHPDRKIIDRDIYCTTRCVFKNRFKCIENTVKYHEDIKEKICASISDEYLLNKLLVNKIISKLNNLKKQNL